MRTNEINREYLDATIHATSGYYTEQGNSLARPLTHLATIGATYTTNKTNSFDISGNYSNREQIKTDVNAKSFFDKSNAVTTKFNRLRYNPETEKEKDATAF